MIAPPRHYIFISASFKIFNFNISKPVSMQVNIKEYDILKKKWSTRGDIQKILNEKEKEITVYANIIGFANFGNINAKYLNECFNTLASQDKNISGAAFQELIQSLIIQPIRKKITEKEVIYVDRVVNDTSSGDSFVEKIQSLRKELKKLKTQTETMSEESKKHLETIESQLKTIEEKTAAYELLDEKNKQMQNVFEKYDVALIEYHKNSKDFYLKLNELMKEMHKSVQLIAEINTNVSIIARFLVSVVQRQLSSQVYFLGKLLTINDKYSEIDVNTVNRFEPSNECSDLNTFLDKIFSKIESKFLAVDNEFPLNMPDNDLSKKYEDDVGGEKIGKYLHKTINNYVEGILETPLRFGFNANALEDYTQGDHTDNTKKLQANAEKITLFLKNIDESLKMQQKYNAKLLEKRNMYEEDIKKNFHQVIKIIKIKCNMQMNNILLSMSNHYQNFTKNQLINGYAAHKFEIIESDMREFFTMIQGKIENIEELTDEEINNCEEKLDQTMRSIENISDTDRFGNIKASILDHVNLYKSFFAKAHSFTEILKKRKETISKLKQKLTDQTNATDIKYKKLSKKYNIAKDLTWEKLEKNPDKLRSLLTDEEINEEMKKIQEDHETRMREFEELTRRNAELSKTIEENEKKLTASGNNLKASENNLENVIKKNNEKKEELKSRLDQEKKQGLEKINKELEKEKEKVTKELIRMRETEQKTLKEQEEQLKNMLIQLQKQIEQKREELEKVMQELIKSQETKSENMKSAENMKKQLAGLKATINRKEEEEKKIMEGLTRLREREYKDIMESSEALQKTYEERMQKELVDLQEQIERKKINLDEAENKSFKHKYEILKEETDLIDQIQKSLLEYKFKNAREIGTAMMNLDRLSNQRTFANDQVNAATRLMTLYATTFFLLLPDVQRKAAMKQCNEFIAQNLLGRKIIDDDGMIRIITELSTQIIKELEGMLSSKKINNMYFPSRREIERFSHDNMNPDSNIFFLFLKNKSNNSVTKIMEAVRADYDTQYKTMLNRINNPAKTVSNETILDENSLAYQLNQAEEDTDDLKIYTSQTSSALPTTLVPQGRSSPYKTPEELLKKLLNLYFASVGEFIKNNTLKQSMETHLFNLNERLNADEKSPQDNMTQSAYVNSVFNQVYWQVVSFEDADDASGIQMNDFAEKYADMFAKTIINKLSNAEIIEINDFLSMLIVTIPYENYNILGVPDKQTQAILNISIINLPDDQIKELFKEIKEHLESFLQSHKNIQDVRQIQTDAAAKQKEIFNLIGQIEMPQDINQKTLYQTVRAVEIYFEKVAQASGQNKEFQSNIYLNIANVGDLLMNTRRGVIDLTNESNSLLNELFTQYPNKLIKNNNNKYESDEMVGGNVHYHGLLISLLFILFFCICYALFNALNDKSSVRGECNGDSRSVVILL
jgi:hypothetical protein